MIKQKRELVELVLRVLPETRDDDNKLLAACWRREMARLNLDSKDTLIALSAGKLSSPETITRCRRKIQETKPELRGKRWNERHGVEEVVKEEMRHWDTAS